MEIVLGIIAFLVMLTAIIAIHELGHLIVAKKCGVYCYEYSIGMGKCLWKHKGVPNPEDRKTWTDRLWKETDFCIRLLPIGGYVQMAGEEDTDEKDVPQAKGKHLNEKGVWKQTAIMLAGIAMNFVLAGASFLVFNLTTPQIVVEESKPIVEKVERGMPAEQAGLKEGDKIIRLKQGKEVVEVTTQYDVSKFIQIFHDELEITYLRDGKEYTTKAKPEKTKDGYILGYYAKAGTFEDASVSDRLSKSVDDFTDTTKDMVDSVGHLAKGQGYDSVSGPVGIAKVVVDSVIYQPTMFWYLLAVVSMNIGIFNLLPIPALDGGRVILLWIEKMTQGRVSKRVTAGLIAVSFVALMVLTVVILGKDILGLL